MILKYNEIDNYVGHFYFSIEPQEARSVFKEMCKEHGIEYDFLKMTSDEDSPFYNFLSEVVVGEILRTDFIISQFFKVNYFTLYSEKKPVTGVMKVVCLCDSNNIELTSDVKYKKISNSILEKRFNEMLLKNEKYTLKTADICNQHSVFTYDLHYVKDGKIIEKITDQEYDADFDYEINPDQYIGLKKGDTTILSQSDVIIEALITNVYEKIPYNEENCDLDFIQEFGYDNFTEFKNYYMKLDSEYLSMIDVSNKIIKYFININDIKVPNEICEEHKYKYKLNENMEIQIVLDAFSRWIYLSDDDYPIVEIANKISEDLKILNMNKNDYDLLDGEVIKYFNSAILYDYYKNK